MHVRMRFEKGARLSLSWLLAVALGLGGWPAPALQGLLSPQVALAEEGAEDPATAGDQEEAVLDEAASQEEDVPADDRAVAEAEDEGGVGDEEEVAAADPEGADVTVDETAEDVAEPAEEPSLPAKADGDSNDEGEGEDGPRYVRWTGTLPGSTIYSDEDLPVMLERDADYPEGDDYKLYVNAGCWEGEPDFGNTLPEGDDGAYTYDEATGTVTLHGQWLCDNDCDHIDLFATVAFEPEGREDEWDIVGGDLIHFGVREGNEYHARVWLEQDNDSDRIYSRSNRTFTVHTENLEEAEANGQQLYVYVGNWFGAPDFTTAFAEGEAYTYDPATGTIVLDGSWSNLLNYDHVDVFALIAPASTDGDDPAWQESIAWDVRNLDVRESREEYNDRVRDDSMLPGWEWEVRRWYDVEYDTAEHPDNEENHPDSYEVVDIQVIEESDGGVVSVRREEWTNDDGEPDWKWCYKAERYGWAKLQVTYLDVHGDTQSYDFTIWVNPDRYQVDLWTEDGSDRALPSATVTLHANAFHQSDHDFDPSKDCYDYQWDFEGNGDIATIRGFGDTATVTFRDCWEGIWENVRPVVRVYLLDEFGDHIKDDNGREMIVAERSINLFVCDDYHELWPCEIDSRLAIGQPLTITPEVRHYQGDGYTVIPGVTFRWENADDNRLDITDNGDGTFTIVRKDAEDTDFRIVGSWPGDDGEPWEKPGWFHLDRLDYGLWFEDGDYTRAYTDDTSGAVTLTPASDDLDALLADGYSLEWSVGVADDYGDFLYNNVLSGDDPVFRFDGTKLVLIGEKMAANEEISEHGGANVCVRLMSGGVEINDAWCWVELRQPREDYELEGDCSLLPGWERTVNHWYHLELDTAEHPEDEENHPDDYEVVDVVSNNPSVVKVDSQRWMNDGVEDWNWRYRAVSYGDANLTVTYLDADGQRKSYDFDVHVQDIVYHLDRWYEGGSDTCLPGQSITAHVQAVQDREHGGGIIEGVTYQWEILEGEEFLDGPIDANGKALTVTFKNAPSDDDHYYRGVLVNVTATKGDLVLHDSFWLNCELRYPELSFVNENGSAVNLDSDLPVGASVTVTPKLIYHGANPEDQSITGVTWDYDDDFASIIDSQGNVIHPGEDVQTGTFTIKRLENWRNTIDLEARWHDPDFDHDGGNRQERISWYFNALGDSKYDVWFDSDTHSTAYDNDDPLVYDDNTLTLVLMADSLGIDDYDVEWEVGDDFDWDSRSWRTNAELLQNGYQTDGNTITLIGSDLPDWNGYVVLATIKQENNVVYRAVQWVGRRNSCAGLGRSHRWVSDDQDIFKQPTVREEGAKTEFCRDCGEVHVVSIPKLRINIATATVSGLSNKTYTGKALTPAPVVKVGGITLKAGTDYSVAYKNNVNVGKATVTITGKGAYGGTKTATFTIIKAAGTLTVTAKAKSVKYSKVKKKAQKVKGAVLASGATGKVSFAFDKSVKKAKKTKKFKISSSGVITVPKKTKKDTYKLKVVVTAAGDANHNPISKTVTVKVKVK